MVQKNNLIAPEYFVKLLQLPKIGKKTALKMVAQLNFRITHDQDLLDFIEDCSTKIKLPQFTESVIEKAFQQAEMILDLSDKLGIRLISYLDTAYPQSLLKTDDFPIVLNYKGNIDSLNLQPSMAVVGTRQPSTLGFKLATRLGEVCAQNKINTVSGLALGCDTAGHLGTLAFRGTTVAVLAHGLDTVYPPDNQSLAEKIIANRGALLSEYFVGQDPVSNFFVERDRIQAGLSECVLIIETAQKGGAMHTAKFCLRYNRILACLNYPGLATEQARVAGNQYLIREKNATPLLSKAEIEQLIIKVRTFHQQLSSQKNIASKNPGPQLGIWE